MSSRAPASAWPAGGSAEQVPPPTVSPGEEGAVLLGARTTEPLPGGHGGWKGLEGGASPPVLQGEPFPAAPSVCVRPEVDCVCCSDI